MFFVLFVPFALGTRRTAYFTTCLLNGRVHTHERDYTIRIAVIFAPERFAALPAALWIDNAVLSVALYRMVFDTFAALFAAVLLVTISFAIAEPFSYNCTDNSPFAVVVPVAP